MVSRRAVPLLLVLFLVICIASLIAFNCFHSCALDRIGPSRTKIGQDGLRLLISIPNKDLLVTASTAGKCRIWKGPLFDSPKSIQFSSPTAGLDVSLDGRFLLSRTDNITIVDTLTWQMTELGLRGKGLSIHCKLLGNNPFLVAVDNENNVRLYDIANPSKYTLFRQPNPAPVCCLTTGRKKMFVAIGCSNGDVKVLDVEASKWILPGKSPQAIEYLSLVAGDAGLVSADADGRLVLWELASGTRIGECLGHGGTGISALESAGDYFFSAGFDYTIRAWDARSLKECWSFETHRHSSAYCLTFCAHSKTLYYGLPTGAVFEVKLSKD